MANLEREALPLPTGFRLSTGSFHKLSALLTLVALAIAFSFGNDAFLTVNNGLTVLLQTSVIGLLGIGMTLVIITGGIDLSVGSVLALSGVVTGLAVKAGVPTAPAMALGIVAGAACGLVNGFVVTKMRITPFVATLGMMLIARGVALQLTGAAPISRLGEAFGILGNGSLFRIVEKTGGIFPKVVFPGIPYPAILLAAVAIAAAYLLNRRQIGRHIYATGSNEEAARLSGVLVDRTKIFAYTLSGALAGLAGNVLMSRLVTVQPNEGVMYELDAIAAAVIGGASLMGGVGNISGTMIGAFIIGVLRNGLNMAGVSAFIQQIVIGVIVIVAVYIDQIRNRR
ncbi:MAG: ABC transporter permease [Roseibium album]|uniref:Ribose ABC transporter permease n=1 Tax=Effrenium voratum TaxID=2562239 RepID=A0AA36MIA5_9DINO|nr:ABC transporter permease [Roseibium album]MBG6144805.1 ribose transport system permease protein [Labrenzia sp. EL_142]MBG6156981.1 ribose transport system permease protein [Labrenzia sp. EL_162]MBG6163408.1 ribose transport system permease protein [Labrenzia sp. EL_195]MBG6172231.1 ribose transport system permease protein [Labrenzia sp. EL_132]MBG6195078.1 ribose transport system permease protein [Labrenzia sp. EL_159]MBG6209627.1 ribose transport system permease protein [Labrenzia sp. EL_